jgi:hypothetical protein
MVTLLQTTNVVVLSFADSVLHAAGIKTVIADTHMSVLEGSLALLPRRLLVADAEAARARRLLMEAGLERELAD